MTEGLPGGQWTCTYAFQSGLRSQVSPEPVGLSRSYWDLVARCFPETTALKTEGPNETVNVLESPGSLGENCALGITSKLNILNYFKFFMCV